MGVDHGAGDDGDSRLERHPGHPGLAAVEAAITRASALGVDAEQRTLAQDTKSGAQRRLGGATPGAVDGHLPRRGHEQPRQQSLEPWRVEVVALGQERDLATAYERQEDRVGERQVIAREDGRALAREMLQAGDLRAIQQAQPRTDEDVLAHPVEQGPRLLSDRASTQVRQYGGTTSRGNVLAGSLTLMAARREGPDPQETPCRS